MPKYCSRCGHAPGRLSLNLVAGTVVVLCSPCLGRVQEVLEEGPLHRRGQLEPIEPDQAEALILAAVDQAEAPSGRTNERKR
jgi:hypothetical protein